MSESSPSVTGDRGCSKKERVDLESFDLDPKSGPRASTPPRAFRSVPAS